MGGDREEGDQKKMFAQATLPGKEKKEEREREIYR
jgi:hypothetical protein